MPQLNKRPIVIQDLIEISTYISYDNLDAYIENNYPNDPETKAAISDIQT